MRTLICRKAWVGLLCLAPMCFAAQPRQVMIITLEGTPYQRGLSHGRVLREEIGRAVAAWKSGLVRSFKLDADEFIRRFAARTDYVSAIRKWTPGLLEEVRGIAEGSGMSLETMLVYQFIDEYWVNGQAVSADEHCSGVGIGATDQHPAVLAQNMDLEGFRDGFQTVLRIKGEGGLETLVLTQPGLIALNGMNNRGVAVTVNTLAQLAHAKSGLPVAFMIRGILEGRNWEAAKAFVSEVPHASGQNYMIASRTGVIDYEASAGKVVAAPAQSAFVYHTNHPLINDNYAEEYRGAKRTGEGTDNSHTRYAALAARLAIDTAAGVIGQIQETLRSHDSEQHPVCRRFAGPDKNCTFASVVMVLGRQPYLLVSAGAPDLNPYLRVDFSSPR